MSANRTLVKCPRCGYAGGDHDPHTVETSSSCGLGFRCAGCAAHFSVAIRRPDHGWKRARARRAQLALKLPKERP